jgi:hypothetical protein
VGQLTLAAAMWRPRHPAHPVTWPKARSPKRSPPAARVSVRGACAGACACVCAQAWTLTVVRQRSASTLGRAARLPGLATGWAWNAAARSGHRGAGVKQGRNTVSGRCWSVVHGVTAGKRGRNPAMGNMKRSRRTPKWPPDRASPGKSPDHAVVIAREGFQQSHRPARNHDRNPGTPFLGSPMEAESSGSLRTLAVVGR